jgi:hypothetical protein
MRNLFHVRDDACSFPQEGGPHGQEEMLIRPAATLV